MHKEKLWSVSKTGLSVLGRESKTEEDGEDGTAAIRGESTMTKFELASAIINDSNAVDLKENVIYWNDGDREATVNFWGNNRYASKIRKLAEEHPDEVHIQSDEKGGYLVAAIPIKVVKLNIIHRQSRELSEEEKEVLRERIRLARESKRANEND